MSRASAERIVEYVERHAVKGDCRCIRCAGRAPASRPIGHTVDLFFFTVGMILPRSTTKEEFAHITRGHEGTFLRIDPLDGAPYDFSDLGAWLGDQGPAIMYMGLGTLIGVFDLSIAGRSPTVVARLAKGPTR